MYLCTGCQLRCQLTVTSEDGSVCAVKGNRCKRGLDLAHRRIKTLPGPFTLRLRVSHGSAARVTARARLPVTPDVAQAVAQAVRHLQFAAPIRVGDVLVQDAAGLGVELLAEQEVGLRATRPRRQTPDSTH